MYMILMWKLFLFKLTCQKPSRSLLIVFIVHQTVPELDNLFQKCNNLTPTCKTKIDLIFVSSLTNAGILSNAQSGFRYNHSTSTTLHDAQDYSFEKYG